MSDNIKTDSNNANSPKNNVKLQTDDINEVVIEWHGIPNYYTVTKLQKILKKLNVNTYKSVKKLKDKYKAYIIFENITEVNKVLPILHHYSFGLSKKKQFVIY